MMRHWLIFFSVAFGLADARANGVTVSGVIQVAMNSRSPREQAHHLSDIVVWLESADGTAIFGSQPQRAEMLQKDKMFHPHVLPIEIGTAVEFPNADPIFHNAFSNYDGQLFDVSLYPPGTSRTVVFRKAGIARVFCNIHPSMSAIILVLKTPYFVKVNSDGQYRIPNVPTGQYELHFYDERAADENRKVVQLTVGGSGEEVNVPVIRILEAGYATVPPHKNKYGQDYPAEEHSYAGDMGPPK